MSRHCLTEIFNKTYAVCDIIIKLDDMSWEYYMLMYIVLQRFNPNSKNAISVIKDITNEISSDIHQHSNIEGKTLIISLLKYIMDTLRRNL